MEDCLTDRLWTDLEASKKLVDNINTLFQQSTGDQEDEEDKHIGCKISGAATVTPSNTESESSLTAPGKLDPAALPLDGVKVEQRLSTKHLSI